MLIAMTTVRLNNKTADTVAQQIEYILAMYSIYVLLNIQWIHMYFGSCN